jgi:hypothetical protein
MAFQAMWVHGHSANIQLNGFGRGPGEDLPGTPWSAVVGLRVGGGAIYRCQDNSQYWFHFAIPTPVLHNGVRARLRRVMTTFTAEPGVTLQSIHLWDGPHQVFKKDGLGVGGVNTGVIDGVNLFALPDVEVGWGIGISALFNFADAANITLHGAGVDFEA